MSTSTSGGFRIKVAFVLKKSAAAVIWSSRVFVPDSVMSKTSMSAVRVSAYEARR